MFALKKRPLPEECPGRCSRSKWCAWSAPGQGRPRFPAGRRTLHNAETMYPLKDLPTYYKFNRNKSTNLNSIMIFVTVSYFAKEMCYYLNCDTHL